MGEGLIVRRGEISIPIVEKNLIAGFYGASNNIPVGWSICDGSGGTPDLRNKFIVCAGDDYLVEDTGGSADVELIEHTHNLISITEAGAHNHTFAIPGNFSGNTNSIGPDSRTNTSDAKGGHSHDLSIPTEGESGVGKNLPPYFGLFYIMNLEVIPIVFDKVVPANIVISWSGNETNIPVGWSICNGSGGTPDLRNKFIVCAGDDYNLGDTGGFIDATLVEHTHTGSTNTLENHTHTIGVGLGGGNQFRNTSGGQTKTTSNSGSHSHSLNLEEVGETPQGKNLPPYYALLYIIKEEE